MYYECQNIDDREVVDPVIHCSNFFAASINFRKNPEIIANSYKKNKTYLCGRKIVYNNIN